MLAYYPYVPIGTFMACNVAIESYNGNLYFGLAGDSAAIPDLRRLRDYVDDAFTQLKKKAGITVKSKPAAAKKTEAAPKPPVRRRTARPVVTPVAESATPDTSPVEPELQDEKVAVAAS